MKITKALLTAAGDDQRKLPLQSLVDRDRSKKTVLEIILKEITNAGIDEIGIVINPDDEQTFRQVLPAEIISSLRFIHQNRPRGYGHAILCGKSFIGNEPFLHLVGDHLYVNRGNNNIAGDLIRMAARHACSVSTVQPTRENSISNYGTVKASRIQGEKHLYQVVRVKEKPTPTFAEQHLIVPGLRAGYYLCFFGMHVFTPLLMELLEKKHLQFPDQKIGLSESLDELAQQSKYLALERNEHRYDLGMDYGLLQAQLALSLSGNDRDYILSELLKFFTEHEMTKEGQYE